MPSVAVAANPKYNVLLTLAPFEIVPAADHKQAKPPPAMVVKFQRPEYALVPLAFFAFTLQYIVYYYLNRSTVFEESVQSRIIKTNVEKAALVETCRR